MTSNIPATSILKPTTKSTAKSISDEQKAKAEKDRRNLGIALYHANKIQAQKDVSARILTSIEVLVDYPCTPAFTYDEARNFARLVEIFQPSDFDALVEERRADGKCGYTLCRKSPRSASLGASKAWRLQSQAAGDYCSNACMRKALYVRTQLNEIPAWERQPGQQDHIVLDEQGGAIEVKPSHAGVHFSGKSATADDELALERGETTQSWKPAQVMSDSIVEKTDLSHKTASPATGSATSHRNIEGYEPKQATKSLKQSSQRSEDSDEEDNLAEQSSGLVNNPTLSLEDKDAEDSWRELYQNLGDSGTG